MNDVEHIKNIRKNILKMHYRTKTSHIGSALSCVEILYNIYFNLWKDGDRVILSKSHASSALYAVLYERGLADISIIDNFCLDDDHLEHCKYNKNIHIDYSGGSLGMGLSYAIGLALGDKNHNIWVVLGDGECDEGSIFEAFNYINRIHGIDNLFVFIDNNNLQGYSIVKKSLLDLDGSCLWFLDNLKIVETIKGKGISFYENRLDSHYRYPSDTEYNLALKELDAI